MLLSLENATKLYADRVIFMGVNAQIEEGDRIGLIGENGVGKTTLLDALAGNFELTDGGARHLRDGVTLGVLKQDSGVFGEHTVYDELREVFAPLLDAEKRMAEISPLLAAMGGTHGKEYETLSEEYARCQSFFESNEGYRIDAQVRSVLNGMGFGERENDICDNLSGGERTRIALAKLLLQKPDLLMLDEPTNHLDFEALRWLEEFLKSYKGALLMVSHDRYFLDKLCNRIWSLSGLKITAYTGNYTKYLFTRDMAYKRELKEYQMQSMKISKLADYVARNKVRASTAAMAKSREKELAKENESLKKPPVSIYPIKLTFRFENQSADLVLHVEDLTMRVGEEEERRDLFTGISFDLRRGERVAVVGDNGVGKSTLLAGLLGRKSLSEGRVRWGINTKVSYYEQGDRELNRERTALDEVWTRFPRTYERDVRRVLANLGLKNEKLETRIGKLSGGERARVKLAIMIYEEGNVLLLDEPTNHFDITTQEAIQKALEQYEGTVIFVTHDRYLLAKTATRVLELTPAGLIDYPKGYEEYELLHTTRLPDAPERPPEALEDAAKEDSPYYRSKKQRAQEVAERARLCVVEQAIADIEYAIEQAQSHLQDPEAIADYKVMGDRIAAIGKLRDELNVLVEEWAELYEKWGGTGEPTPMKPYNDAPRKDRDPFEPRIIEEKPEPLLPGMLIPFRNL